MKKIGKTYAVFIIYKICKFSWVKFWGFSINFLIKTVLLPKEYKIYWEISMTASGKITILSNFEEIFYFSSCDSEGISANL